jgi:hypothetical protein
MQGGLGTGAGAVAKTSLMSVHIKAMGPDTWTGRLLQVPFTPWYTGLLVLFPRCISVLVGACSSTR